MFYELSTHSLQNLHRLGNFVVVYELKSLEITHSNCQQIITKARTHKKTDLL